MKLLAIDISNLVIRHALNPYGSATDLLGRSIQGPVGAISQVARSMYSSSVEPTHLLIAKDTPRAQSVRLQFDDQYKAKRKDTEEDVKRQFDLTWQLLDILKWPVVSFAGYEADDVIASAAKKFQGTTHIVSGHRDFLAVTNNPQVKLELLQVGGSRICRKEDCFDIYGVWPHQLSDYKALVGDPSDNIKGIPGIGKKTALTLLNQYPDLASIYKAIESEEEIPGLSKGMRTKIEQGRDHARTSWNLGRLYSHLDVNIPALAVKPLPNQQDIIAMFKQLEVESAAHQIMRFFPKKPVDDNTVFSQSSLHAINNVDPILWGED